MSNTIRRKQGHGWGYGHRDINDILTDTKFVWRDLGDGYQWREWVDIKIDPKSKEGKKRIAKFHSDASWHYNRKGKGWWRNYYLQRPYRRDAERQIQKAMMDDDFEVIIRDKPARNWWD